MSFISNSHINIINKAYLKYKCNHCLPPRMILIHPNNLGIVFLAMSRLDQVEPGDPISSGCLLPVCVVVVIKPCTLSPGLHADVAEKQHGKLFMLDYGYYLPKH